MTIFLLILHIIVSIALIAIVLLQSGKGAEMGASFGAGGSQSVFGAGGDSSFMSKLTTGAAIIFMLTSLTLAYRSSHISSSSLMPSKPAQKSGEQKPAAPAGQQIPIQPQPAAPASTPQPVKTAPQTAPAPAPANK